MTILQQGFSGFAALSGKRRSCLWSVVGWLALACGSGGPKQSNADAQTTLVRPATSATVAQAEPAPEPLPGEPAPADIPRGVSAPEATGQEAQGEPGHENAHPAKHAQPAHAAKAAPAEPKAPKPTAAAKTERAKTSTPARPSAPQPSAPAAAPPAAMPDPQPVAAAPKHATVQVPSTEHVHVDVPAGLQSWLDADDRMRPWLGKAIAVADGCYAKIRADNASAAGEIALRVTMHENARPSGGVASASPAVSGITMCATTKLLGVKMPLFTGREGETYTVRVRFSP